MKGTNIIKVMCLVVLLVVTGILGLITLPVFVILGLFNEALEDYVNDWWELIDFTFTWIVDWIKELVEC